MIIMQLTDQQKSYIAGFIDGDGTICIGKCNTGFQLKLEITQCNENFLNNFNTLFENGKMYKDNRKDKYLTESAFQLRFCGINSKPLLLLMKDYGIIKSKQAEMALEFLLIANKVGKTEEKQEMYTKMKQMNKDKSSYDKPYERLNTAYIAGLFDAEGNVYFNEDLKKKRHYVKITQKSDPTLISRIQIYLQYGKISKSEPYRIRFFSKIDTNRFYEAVKDYSTIKIIKLKELIDII